MAKFDYNSRKKLGEKLLQRWESDHLVRISFLREKDKPLIGVIDSLLSYKRPDTSQLDSILNKNADKTSLAGVIRSNLNSIVRLYVPKEYIDDYYYIVDKYVKFQYTSGLSRRSLRTKKIDVHFYNAVKALLTYRTIGLFRASLVDFLKDNLSEELVDFKKDFGYIPKISLDNLDDVIAARIDAHDSKIISYITETLMGENNTFAVNVPVIRGILKSDSDELQTLLSKFFVAAGLQEGIRQAVCENADCGTAKGFLKIVDAVQSENMIRFSSVKRAIATWTGICSVEHFERISEKTFELIFETIRNRDEAYRLIETSDSVNIMVGLWALGFYEAQDAIEAMQKVAQSGTRNQLLTISYYNLSLQNRIMADSVSVNILDKYRDDLELVAAFFPSYFSWSDNIVRKITEEGKKNHNLYRKYKVEDYFPSAERARVEYNILDYILKKMDKKKVEFSPCIFPWYSVSMSKGDIVGKMSLIAFLLHDDKLIDEMCGLLAEIDSESFLRYRYIDLLLNDPKTDKQRDAIITYLSDRETESRKVAFNRVSEMKLSDEEYIRIEQLLKYKTQFVRDNVLGLLRERTDKDLKESIKRLLSSKDEMTRLGGLDIVKTKCEENEAGRDEWVKLLKDLKNPGERERVIIEGISGEASDILQKEGYGLYDPKVQLKKDFDTTADLSILASFFDVSMGTLGEISKKISDFLNLHGKDEFKDFTGETRLLINGIVASKRNYKAKCWERFPFIELWQKIYEDIICDEKTFWNLYFFVNKNFIYFDTVLPLEYIPFLEKIFGKLIANSVYNRNIVPYLTGNKDVKIILDCIKSYYGFKFPRKVAIECAKYCISIPKPKRWYKKERNSWGKSLWVSFVYDFRIAEVLNSLNECDTKEEFEEQFFLLCKLNESFDFWNHFDIEYSYQFRNMKFVLSMYDFLKAYEYKLIPVDSLYKFAFEIIPIEEAVSQLSLFVKHKPFPFEIDNVSPFLEGKPFDNEHPYIRLGKEIYEKITDLILDIELKRGDSETIFSKSIIRMSAVYGIEKMVAILKALGNDTFERSSYYRSTDKKICMSHLIQVSYPSEGDDSNKLRELLKDSSIKENRLIETALFAPQWIDIIEEYLGYRGFKSTCYYFMAHMDERFDDRKKAMIAKYTPLSEEELQEGCFDVDWFFDAYNTLGEKTFSVIYGAAKYTSAANKHARARKFADAALGKVKREDLETEINEKRNKDLLLSYGLLPIKDEKDILHRYEFIQKFLKESKQFGAQRRASESKCCEMALKNLSRRAGYADDMRLILAMEAAIVADNSRMFEKTEVNGYTLYVTVNELGKTELVIEKEGKKLKSVPSAVKGEEEFDLRKEFVTKLRNQYSRCVSMFENSMENRDYYSGTELLLLCKNPVISAIIKNLVFISDKDSDKNVICMISEDGFIGVNGESADVASDSLFRLVHSYDLYVGKCWHDYQKCFFEKQQSSGVKQPFKQVFRELYLKLPEELDAMDSRMFAGNQIQPSKAKAVLKTRQWVADYEAGLQKIYYKDNIIANIYALADWFSPSDIEYPTIEYVSFCDRKNFEPIKISDLSPIVYSEVMRDTDLAVSVAHAGGVDPLTSHSTIEMRKVIVSFNLELFKLSNVSLEGTHAIVKGTLCDYSIHLGSGVIHKLGGQMINVLPVHSQHRGKIFLPFVDDDPKTAEIMSKIILFAQDNKIKDPYIIEQIK